MENKESFGECFVAGRIVNLDATKADDLERYLVEEKVQKAEAIKRFDKLINELRA